MDRGPSHFTDERWPGVPERDPSERAKGQGKEPHERSERRSVRGGFGLKSIVYSNVE